LPIAYNLIRDQPCYRRDAFVAGLKACGYRVEKGFGPPEPGAVLVIWNRDIGSDLAAKRFEAGGCQVIVAENGYLGREWRDGIWYALALNRHNGGGTWPHGDAARWDGWNVQLTPWRSSGDHVLVLPARGIGVAPVRQPDFWEEQALSWLKKNTKRPVRVRKHPGTADPRPVDQGLLKDLAGAHCVVTWGSGAALKALLHGVPCFNSYPGWIGASASAAFGNCLEQPSLTDRLPMFRRLAWAMWRLDEIESGEAFRALLPAAR
jgi:hypothetical protein